MSEDQAFDKEGHDPEEVVEVEHETSNTKEQDGIAEAEDEPEGEDDEDEGIETSDFEVNDPTMLLGEMRDDVLAGIKGPIGWSKLKEAQQVFIANGVEQACRRVIRGAMRIAASMDLDAVEVTLSGTTHKTDKDQIEAKVLCPFDPETWAAMPAHGKRVLVFADHEKLMGARAASVMRDQPGLFADGTETPAEKAKREAIDKEAAEQEASVARARKFKPLDDGPPTIDNDTGTIVTPAPPPVLLLGSMLSPEIKAAFDRGVAHRQADGARKIPIDLEGKVAEANAWLKGYDAAEAGTAPERAADVAQAQASGSEVDPDTGEVYRGHASARTDEATRNYEAALKIVAQQAMRGRDLVSGPIDVLMVATLPIPASWSGKRRLDALVGRDRPTTKPDADNIAKMCDALNGVVWGDDAAIVDHTVRKFYGASPGLLIEIRPGEVEPPLPPMPPKLPKARKGVVRMRDLLDASGDGL